MTAMALVAVGGTIAACSSSVGTADSYWDGYHTGYKIASDYAKRIGETELSYCQSEQAVASQCDHPWDRRYPEIVGRRDCANHMPARLSTDQRAAWHEGCVVGVTFEVPDTVSYGPDPSEKEPSS
ncbi:hypothetical protein ABT010_41440 [Streptomyces sp. NPDC002668]|uniref:hypothetical protein n=1 Tax=Streptomyces sp. NPDC002668 TaxID=3154422 RepID=UPI00333218D4